MTSAAITIGRNVSGQAMSPQRWRAFIADVTRVVRRGGGTIHLIARGVGHWHGASEEAVVVTLDVEQVDQIAAELPRLARDYGQDAIALLIGSTMLVERTGVHTQEAQGLSAGPVGRG